MAATSSEEDTTWARYCQRLLHENETYHYDGRDYEEWTRIWDQEIIDDDHRINEELAQLRALQEKERTHLPTDKEDEEYDRPKSGEDQGDANNEWMSWQHRALKVEQRAQEQEERACEAERRVREHEDTLRQMQEQLESPQVRHAMEMEEQNRAQYRRQGLLQQQRGHHRRGAQGGGTPTTPVWNDGTPRTPPSAATPWTMLRGRGPVSSLDEEEMRKVMRKRAEKKMGAMSDLNLSMPPLELLEQLHIGRAVAAQLKASSRQEREALLDRFSSEERAVIEQEEGRILAERPELGPDANQVAEMAVLQAAGNNTASLETPVWTATNWGRQRRQRPSCLAWR